MHQALTCPVSPKEVSEAVDPLINIPLSACDALRKPSSFRHHRSPHSSSASLSGKDVCLQEDGPNFSDLDLLDSGTPLQRAEPLRRFW